MCEFSNHHKCRYQLSMFFTFLAQITALNPRHFLSSLVLKAFPQQLQLPRNFFVNHSFSFHLPGESRFWWLHQRRSLNFQLTLHHAPAHILPLMPFIFQVEVWNLTLQLHFVISPLCLWSVGYHHLWCLVVTVQLCWCLLGSIYWKPQLLMVKTRAALLLSPLK